jgi:hypothetical protein
VIRAFEDVYDNLEGKLLEALARLFAKNVRNYVYLMTAADLREWLKSAPRTVGSGVRRMDGFRQANWVARHLSDIYSPTFSPATFLSLCDSLSRHESLRSDVYVGAISRTHGQRQQILAVHHLHIADSTLNHSRTTSKVRFQNQKSDHFSAKTSLTRSPRPDAAGCNQLTDKASHRLSRCVAGSIHQEHDCYCDRNADVVRFG